MATGVLNKIRAMSEPGRLESRAVTSRDWLEHWPAAVVLVLAAILVFAYLGVTASGPTKATRSKSVEHPQVRVPTAWDGMALIDSDFARANDDLVIRAIRGCDHLTATSLRCS
jgi:hypothetical protein